MNPFVVVATKGRSKQTYILLDFLARQSSRPVHIAVVGSEAKDIEGLDAHPSVASGLTSLRLASAGATIQRNAGLDALQPHVAQFPASDWFVAFFDDDFRPADDWLANAASAFARHSDVVGINGLVLADGVTSEFGISEEDAVRYISGEKASDKLRTTPPEARPLTGLYGCNMAYRGIAAEALRFDEQLPMYAWQEDIDFSSRSRQFGRLVLLSACRGVHLGVSSGRTSGVRFGYSQIANPIFLMKKGTMSKSMGFKLMSKNILSNLIKTALKVRIKDFPGRLRGNLRAGLDLLSGKLHPMRAVDL